MNTTNGSFLSIPSLPEPLTEDERSDFHRRYRDEDINRMMRAMAELSSTMSNSNINLEDPQTFQIAESETYSFLREMNFPQAHQFLSIVERYRAQADEIINMIRNIPGIEDVFMNSGNPIELRFETLPIPNDTDEEEENNRDEEENIVQSQTTNNRMQKCTECQKQVVNIKRKYSLCLDCLVDKLKECGILIRRDSHMGNSEPDEQTGKKICEYCLEPYINRNRTTSVCCDCIVLSLESCRLITRKSCSRIIVNKVRPQDPDCNEFFDKLRKKEFNKECNFCHQHIIHNKREEPVCMDCVLDILIEKDIFRINEEVVYQIL